MNPNELAIGDTISESPVGAGVITTITEAGFPRVDEVAVAWVRRVDGATFDPYSKVGGSKDGNPAWAGASTCS